MFYWKTKVGPLVKHIRYNHTMGLSLMLFFTASCLLSCVTNPPQVASYYPVDSLLDHQIDALLQSQASIRKVGMLDQKEMKMEFTPDSAAWLKELNVFINLNVLNKSINQGAYEIQDGTLDTKSNLKIKSFTAKENLPVEYLKLFYEGTLSNLRKLEARYSESNSMYESTRFLYMEFEDINNTPLLTYYSIVGGQKMFLGDTVQYTINTAVSIP